jgi:hypothetical protein
MRKLILILFLLSLVFSRTSAQSTRDTSVIMCSGDSATMSATFSNTDSVQWFKNDFPIFGANNDTFVTYEGGTYYVVAYQAGCSDESGDILVKMATPTVIDDHFMFGLGRTETLGILENDEPTCAPFDLTTLQIVKPPKFGNIVSLVSGKVLYRSAVTEIESDQFSYQIKDVDGRLSNIATVFIDIDFNCGMVYPNPVGEELHVVVNPKRIHAMNLYDSNGKLLYSSEVSQINYKINMGAYAQGMYLLEFIEKNGPGCKIKVQKTL